MAVKVPTTYRLAAEAFVPTPLLLRLVIRFFRRDPFPQILCQGLSVVLRSTPLAGALLPAAEPLPTEDGRLGAFVAKCVLLRVASLRRLVVDWFLDLLE